jgi:DNA-binding MarR family transcriptional regulator
VTPAQVQTALQQLQNVWIDFGPMQFRGTEILHRLHNQCQIKGHFTEDDIIDTFTTRGNETSYYNKNLIIKYLTETGCLTLLRRVTPSRLTQYQITALGYRVLEQLTGRVHSTVLSPSPIPELTEAHDIVFLDPPADFLQPAAPSPPSQPPTMPPNPLRLLIEPVAPKASRHTHWALLAAIDKLTPRPYFAPLSPFLGKPNVTAGKLQKALLLSESELKPALETLHKAGLVEKIPGWRRSRDGWILTKQGSHLVKRGDPQGADTYKPDELLALVHHEQRQLEARRNVLESHLTQVSADVQRVEADLKQLQENLRQSQRKQDSDSPDSSNGLTHKLETTQRAIEIKTRVLKTMQDRQESGRKMVEAALERLSVREAQLQEAAAMIELLTVNQHMAALEQAVQGEGVAGEQQPQTTQAILETIFALIREERSASPLPQPSPPDPLDALIQAQLEKDAQTIPAETQSSQ